ncbi:MAG: MoxR family ATPase, partial [Chloroflexota bacterium]
APNGSDTTGDGTSTKPWATFTKAYGSMQGGDTLIAKNGTYKRQRLLYKDNGTMAPPSGSSARYTVIRAETDGQVTIDGELHTLPRPFLVLATQNPIEYEGTFPLPEAQLDRFLMRLNLGYPSMTDEVTILDRQQHIHPIESLQEVVAVQDLLKMNDSVKAIHVDALVKQYIVAIADATRHHEGVYLGASPRGSLALFRTSQALALLRGRDFVLPDDIKFLAPYALAHRIIVSPTARVKDITADKIVMDVLEQVPVPGARAGRWIGSANS